MNSANEPLKISTDVLDAMFVHVLRVYVTQAVPPPYIWEHIEKDVQHFPPQGDFDISHLPEASYTPLTKI